MSRFDQYFLMETTDVIDYVKEKLDLFDPLSDLVCQEIGDGNLNYVFRVRDPLSGRSVIVKQAGDTARISDDFKLSTERIKIESNVLRLEGKLAPGLVPKVYGYDDIMNCCLMEDLSDFVILRQALMEQRIFPKFADHISTFMVNTLLLTSDVVMEHKAKKQQVKEYINPELCEISEDLVYSEPYNDYQGRNELFAPNADWIKQEIYGDQELHLEAAKCKFEFMNHAQALIHGDLHTGSVFITSEHTKVIDPEFAFYGPMGYDVGNVIANLIFSWAHADALPTDQKSIHFLNWVQQTVVDVIDQFKEKFIQSWNTHVTDVMAKTLGFSDWYLAQVIQDTAAVTGLELIRRIVGLAKVKDITSIEDSKSRVRAERICLLVGKELIKNRFTKKNGSDFLNVLTTTAGKFVS